MQNPPPLPPLPIPLAIIRCLLCSGGIPARPATRTTGRALLLGGQAGLLLIVRARRLKHLASDALPYLHQAWLRFLL